MSLLTWESRISELRVPELQQLLIHFNINRLGRKQELVIRAIQLLRTPQKQAEVQKFLSDILKMNNRSRPYTIPQHPMQHRGYVPQNNYQLMFPNGGVTMGMYNAPPQASHNRQVRLKPSNLPFYDHICTLLEPSELPAIPSGIKNMQKAQFTFTIPPHIQPSLIYRDNVKQLPRYEVQLRFFYLPPNYQNFDQPDDFPPNCNVKVDDCMVVLPSIIPTNKPNTEAKRPSRPVNITQNCQPLRDAGHGGIRPPHRLWVDWTGDRRAWAVAVYVVNRVTSDILRDRAVANAAVKQDAATTRQQIIKRMTVGDDDGIKMDQVRISLLCPLGKTRMGIPARCKDCTHLQCFDLDLFLKMNEKKPTWKCGICSGNAPYNRLIIDGYFQDVLRDVKDANEVELLTTGGYQKIQEVINGVASDSDDEGGPTTSSEARKQNVASKPTTNDDDIITLDSDDEDDVQRVIIASSKDNTKQKATSTPSKSVEHEVIVIDDDDEPSCTSRTIRPTESRDAGISNNITPGSVQSSISISPISPPIGTPGSVPSTSTAYTASWGDNAFQMGNRNNHTTPTFNYQQLAQQPFTIPQINPMGNFPMWNNFAQSAFTIGGNLPGYRNGAQLNGMFNMEQSNAPRQLPNSNHIPPQSISNPQGQTLADALNAISANPAVSYPNNFQQQ